MRSVAPVTVAFLMVLAGCHGAAVDETGPVSSVTPAPIPTVDPSQLTTGSPSPTRRPWLAPGLSTDGVVDPWAAASAHRASLRTTNYTVRTIEVVSTANGTLRSRVATTARIGPGGTPIHRVIEVHGSLAATPWGAERIELWTEADTIYEMTRGDDQRFDTYPRTYTATRRTVYQLFRAMRTRIADEVTRNGTTTYRVEAVELVSPTLLAGAEDVENPRNVTFVAWIDSTGVVRTYRLTYTAYHRDETLRVVRTVEFDLIGETRLERPTWVDGMANGTPAVDKAG